MTDKKPEPPQKNMARVSLGFVDVVLPVPEAVKIMQALEKAERYQYRYRRDEDGGPSHYIWAEAPRIEMELMSYDTYLQGKFTGKPEDI